MPLLVCKEDNFLNLLGVAPHMPNLAFSFSGVYLRPVGGCSAHAKSCFFFSGVYLRPVGCCSAHAKSCFFFSGVYLRPVGGVLRTRQTLLFSFLACTCALLGVLRTRQTLLFSFLACACACWVLLRTRQTLLFSFLACTCACWVLLRTRQTLLFLLMSVKAPVGGCKPPTLGGTPTHKRVYIIYRAINDCNFAVYRPITAILQCAVSCKNRPMTAKILQIVKQFNTVCKFTYPLYPGSLRPTFSPSIQYPPSAFSRCFIVRGFRSMYSAIA